MWSETRGRGVHWGEQVLCRVRKVSLHAHEERDEVFRLLEAVGGANTGSWMSAVKSCDFHFRKVTTVIIDILKKTRRLCVCRCHILFYNI